MANYSVNNNLPGPKKVFTSEAAPVLGSSMMVPAFVVSLDGANMQSTIDGYLDCQTNTTANQVVIQHTSAIGANDLVGSFVFVNFPTAEVREIVANTAAVADASCTITVLRDFSAAPTDGNSCNIRLWEDFGIPKLFSSFNAFAETFIDKDTSGNYEWTDCENAFYTISEFKNNGGALFYVIPVVEDTDADVMVERLGTGLTGDATFKARMLAASPQADIICVPKQPKMAATLSAANWATVDTAWVSYVESRATDDSADDALREIFVVADTPSASTSLAVTYRTTDLNTTAERIELVHGQYLAASLTRGQMQAVAASPARCAVINRISSTAPESYGHAFEGANYSQVAIQGLVERDISPANRINLMGNGINPLITKPGRGAWFESQVTQKHNAAAVGADPVEHAHIVLGRGKIWNQLQPILESVVAEPNTAVTRMGVRARIDSIMGTLQSQGIIVGYTIADVTSVVDVSSGTARFELRVVFNREIDFVELKLTAAIGG